MRRNTLLKRVLSEKGGVQWEGGRHAVNEGAGKDFYTIRQNPMKRSGPGHSVNRRTLKTEKLLFLSPSRKSALICALFSCRSWHLSRQPFCQKTTQDPEIEGSRSQQRSVTDRPPLSGCTETLQNMCFGSFRAPEERSYWTLITSRTLDFRVFCHVLSLSQPLTSQFAILKFRTEKTVPVHRVSFWKGGF